MALNHDLKPLHINTDSLELLNMLRQGNYKYDNIIWECRYLMSLLKPMEVTYVFREANRVVE